jgi:hypothetical protein
LVLSGRVSGGLIARDDIREMLAREHSDFSLDATVRIAAQDDARLD